MYRMLCYLPMHRKQMAVRRKKKAGRTAHQGVVRAEEDLEEEGKVVADWVEVDLHDFSPCLASALASNVALSLTPLPAA